MQCPNMDGLNTDKRDANRAAVRHRRRRTSLLKLLLIGWYPKGKWDLANQTRTDLDWRDLIEIS